MKREEKDQIINDLSQKLSVSPHIYITDIADLTVEKTSQLRRMCFNKGISLQVAKNTMIRKAMEKTGDKYAPLFDVLKGSSSIMFCETANMPAKVIKEFRTKGNAKPILKAAYVESSVYIGDAQLNILADLKSKNELIADVIALLQSPAKNVISALQSGKNKLAGIVKTLSEKAE